MKVFVCVNNYGDENRGNAGGWYYLADSSVTNTGKPFYLPENMGRVTVSLSGIIKISRLGKLVTPKFAQRYFSEMAPGLHFTLPDYKNHLKEEGLPEDPARNFDRSLFVGDFMEFSTDKSFELWKNGEMIRMFNFNELLVSPEDLIAEISVMNTLKMGDLLVPGLSGEIELGIGDFLEVKTNGENAFHVKVK